MSEVERSLIKTGFWTNHAQGTVLGATITLEQQYSNLIVALVAVVVTTAASSAFNLCLFVLYQIRATEETEDGLYWQQQALYRSLASPGTVLVDSLKFLHAWRGKTSKPILTRCLIPASIGLLFAVGSLAAGVFSSYIVSTTDLEVLVRGDECRLLNFTATAFTSENLADIAYYTALDAATRSFAQRCYTPGPLPSDCNFYIQPRIESGLGFVDCPFESSLCFNGTKAAVLDSGYLDSNDVLGINAPEKDRVLVRRETTCVPLDTESRTALLSSSDPIIADRTASSYPPSLDGVNSWRVARFGTRTGYSDNVTTVRSTLASNVSTTYLFDSVTARQFVNPSLGSNFMSIEGLSTQQGDISLVFVSTNSVLSFTPIDDPIYSAHTEVYDAYLDSTSYVADYPISTLGCIEKWEFCVRVSGELECTPPVGAITNFDSLRRHVPSANPIQQATFDIIASVTGMTNLADAVLSPQPFLNVTSRLYSGFFAQDVPEDQWVLDFQALESYVWAFNQLAILNHFTGYPGVTNESTILPSSPAARQVCRNQKVVEAGSFANINVFGFAFTLAVAGTLLLLDFVGLRMYTTQGQVRQFPSVRSWIDDGLYQLQRQAFELYVKVPWDRTCKEIPVTGKDQVLDSLSKCAARASRTAVKLSPSHNTSRPNSAMQGTNILPSSNSIHSTGASQPTSTVQPADPTLSSNTTQSSNYNQASNSPSRPTSVRASSVTAVGSQHTSAGTLNSTVSVHSTATQ